MFLWLLVFLFTYLTLKISYWFLIGLIIFSLLKACDWHRYNRRPWQKIHYKAIKIYLTVAGQEKSMAKTKNVEFNLRNSLLSFTEMLFIKGLLRTGHPEKIVDRELDMIKNFKDRPLIKDHFINVVFKNSPLKKLIDIDVMIENFLNEMQSSINENYQDSMVILIIANAIENIYSAADRGEYLYEYFSGNIN